MLNDSANVLDSTRNRKTLDISFRADFKGMYYRRVISKKRSMGYRDKRRQAKWDWGMRNPHQLSTF